MPAKKTQPAAAPAKNAATPKTAVKKTAAATLKAPSATANHTLTLEKKSNPKNLDRLNIPGASGDGDEAGIAAWLFESGLTLEVQRNWVASPGDIITVGKLIDETTVEVLGIKTLEPGEETRNSYYFAAQQKDLPDGRYALVYVVHYKGGADYDMSYPLLTLVKTDLPAGADNDQIEPGHSELKVSVSEKVIVPGNAAQGVVVTLQPYPNHDPDDRVILHWGSVIIYQTVAGPSQPTMITVTYQHIIDAGDSPNMAVWLEVLDKVGNISTPGSATIRVSVELDISKPDAPAFLNAGSQAKYIDLEALNEQPLELQMFTSATIGQKDDVYDVMFRCYPPKGGVKVIHKFVTITTAGRPYSVFIDYVDVRAAAEGHVEVSFVLRKSGPPFEVYSKRNTAEVRGSIARLEAPSVERYGDHIVGDPDHVVVEIPYYAWRQPTDQIALILRYVRSLNDVIVHMETKEVGPSWPAGSPVKRLIYREQLQQFKGLHPELYYVISTRFTLARAQDLNESLRRKLTIS
ncbi:hypothetical protein [Pseudomonas veronii]|uniref:Uncharacterized protein n=1 Tax=Pseudomonas veronii TaxID=76761 RepID=A0A5M8E6I4_PSEVE|nr:hypothetical protein [Pseudomonas veronii]KAA6168478.1 hypothetical protein F3K53_30840 [Pseudomonas veronii]KAA6169072.1 hypothetical protein F3K54_26895 [Pseudomonas veronii]